MSIRYAGPEGRDIGCDLVPGQRATFAVCTCAGCGFDLVLAATMPFDTAGAIAAYPDHWRLDNLSRTAVLICTDLEDAGQHVRVPPGRADVVIPFELAQLSTIGQPSSGALIVFGPEPTSVPASALCGQARMEAPRLNPNTIHYAVLWALCQPYLKVSADLAIPTTSQVAMLLKRHGCIISRRSIEHHIDYLADRLGIGTRPDGPRARAWKREAIARRAVFLGVVDSEPTWGRVVSLGPVSTPSDVLQPGFAEETPILDSPSMLPGSKSECEIARNRDEFHTRRSFN